MKFTIELTLNDMRNLIKMIRENTDNNPMTMDAYYAAKKLEKALTDTINTSESELLKEEEQKAATLKKEEEIKKATKAFKEFIYNSKTYSWLEMSEFATAYCEREKLDYDYYHLGLELLEYYKEHPLYKDDIVEPAPKWLISFCFEEVA